MAMPKPVKVGLFVLLGLLILGGGTCGGFLAWVKSNEADWRLKGKEAQKEGQRFGVDHSGEECLEEALKRAAPCGELSALRAGTCQAFAGAFFDQCLTASKPGPEICDGVPPEKSVLGLVAYSKKKCTDRGELDEQCMKTFQNLAEWCIRQRAPEG
jgi:hypothetical protein